MDKYHISICTMKPNGLVYSQRSVFHSPEGFFIYNLWHYMKVCHISNVFTMSFSTSAARFCHVSIPEPDLEPTGWN